MILVIISGLLLFAYAVLMAAYTRGWHLQQGPPGQPAFAPVSVSVIIPARNEEQQIGPCLQSILENDYPGHLLEIIVIDDFSTDRTAAVASSLLAGGKGRVLGLAGYLSAEQRLNAYKKKALEIAIGVARGEWIITTDADCIAPPGWLQQMAKAMQETDTQFIAAPVSFTPALPRKGLLYYFQSLDFMTMQGITAASVRMQLGNMCNGANLAFRKAAFEAVSGYQGIDHIASGDDMLLMYKIRQHYPQGVAYLKSQEAIMATPAQPTWRSFLNQRIRWSSKADQYDEKKLTYILALVYCFNLGLLILTLVACFRSGLWPWLFGMLFVKTFVELVFLVPVAAFYRKLPELILFPFLQPLHILYIVTAGFLGKFGSYEWKGRRVK